MIRRRPMLLGALASLAACDRPQSDRTPAPSGSATEGWRELAFEPGAYERELAAVLAVSRAPLLIALHGRGEAGRGLEAGARGWRDDYDLDRAHRRLAAPPLTAEDFHGFVRPERLRELNESLAKHPYRGLAVACPYTPALADRTPDGAKPFGKFIAETLVPRVRTELSLEERAGIDGVSMGGRLALFLGFARPDVFHTVGALQPAIDVSEAGRFADLCAEARRRAPQALRLVSSDDDPFLEAVRALSHELEQRKLEHKLVITPGPHDYIWNRGPGAYEMLVWHERVLRKLPGP
jgi:hypothetical protein